MLEPCHETLNRVAPSLLSQPGAVAVSALVLAAAQSSQTMIASFAGPGLAQELWGGKPMSVDDRIAEPTEQPIDKGLKSGALGLISSTVIATASVAPAYSIAATLVFVVLAVGLIFFAYNRITSPAFFKGQTLTRATPTLVPDPDVAGASPPGAAPTQPA
jgi:hypothetical protein